MEAIADYNTEYKTQIAGLKECYGRYVSKKRQKLCFVNTGSQNKLICIV